MSDVAMMSLSGMPTHGNCSVPLWRRSETGAFEEVAAIELEPRIHVPGQSHQATTDAVGLDYPGKLALDESLQPSRDRFDRVNCRQFRDPAVTDLAEIGKRTAGKRGKQSLMCSAPWKRLNPHLREPGPRKGGEQVGHLFGLRSHCPEFQA